MQWLAIWGVTQAAWFVFRPVLEELAKDAAKSSVQECFKSVFSVIYRDPLTKATGRALKELLELIQNELLDCDLDRDDLKDWIEDVRQFTRQPDVLATVSTLYLEPSHKLDPAVFARAWQQVAAHTLPEDFSWERIAKRFSREVVAIRESSVELRDMFNRLATAQMANDLRELAGLPPEFDLDKYREALVERFGNLDFAMLDTTGAYYSNVRLWSVFVPQSVRECHEYTPQLLEIPKEHIQRLVERGELDAEQLAEAERMQDTRRREYFSQPLRPVLEVAGGPSHDKLVILGDPGSGKSSLLQFLALRWATIEDANLRYTQPLPVLIELRDYNRWDCPSDKSFPAYLHKASTWHQLNQHTLDYLLKQPGRVVLLLDGLDEVFDPVQRERVVNDIHRFSNDYKGTGIVVTSRVVGYQPKRLRDAEFRHFMLQDLDDQQIDSFLDRWHNVTFDNATEAAAKRERLVRAIRNSKPIAMLAGNPLLLTMMAILNRHQELPRDRTELYQQASRVLLHQWDTERALGDFPELQGQVDLRAKTEILRSIANYMQSSTGGLAGNLIDGQTLNSLIEDYLHTELHFQQSRAAAHALVEQLRGRNFMLCDLGADSYAFVHRTFLEYFCAADIVHKFNVTKTLDEQGLIDLFDDHCRDDDWHEVLRLICGQIDEQLVGRIVEHLLTRVEFDPASVMEVHSGDLTYPELPLAIYCLSEARSTARFDYVGTCLLELIFKVVGAFASTHQTEYDSPFGEWADTSDAYNDRFFANLLAATRALGPKWPGKDEYDALVFLKLESNSTWAGAFLPQLLSVVFHRRDLLITLSSSKFVVTRAASFEAMGGTWPDEGTRKLLTERAAQDKHEYPRRAALRVLVEKWPDENTRKLLAERAVQGEEGFTRRALLQALAEMWPDENTRKLLAERAIQDEDEFTRRDALQALAAKWPDENTLELLESQVSSFKNERLRSEIEKTIESLQAKLSGGQPRSGSTT